MKRIVCAFVGAGCAAGTALAADVGLVTYPPPPVGDPVYSHASGMSGDISIAGGWWGDNYDDRGGVFAGAGRLNVPLQGGPWNVTGEIAGIGYTLNGDSEREFLGAAHVYHKTSQFAHGVYASAVGYGWGGSPIYSAWGLGIEGAAFMSNTTLVGRLGHYWDEGYSYWSAEGIARYYVTPNTKLAGLAAWTDGDWMAAAGIEHLFSGTPMTGYARVAYFDAGSSYNWWELMAGVRFLFHGPKTLQQHDWDIPFAEATVVNF